MYNQKLAPAGEGVLLIRDDHDPEGIRQLFVILRILLIFRLCNEDVGQLIAALQLEKALEIVRLVPPDAESFHQVQDQPVVVLPDLVAGVLLRPEIARDAELVRAVEHDAGPLVHDALGDDNMGGQAPLPVAVKMNEAAHGGQEPLGDGEPKPKPPREAVASGVRLVKDVVHLRQLGIRHTDSGVADVYNQVDAVILPAVPDADVYAALLRKLNGVFHQDFEHMGDFLRVPDQGCRNFGINVKHQLQMLAVALQGGHGDHVVQHGGDHVLFLGRGQRALHDLRIVQHVVDLVGQALSRHFYGGHVRPDIRGKFLSERHLADADYHVNGRAELVGYVREEDGVLLSRRLQLCEYALIPHLLRIPPVDPVSGQGRCAKSHDDAEDQAE